MDRRCLVLVLALGVVPRAPAKAAADDDLTRAKLQHRNFEFAECLATLDVAAAQEMTSKGLAQIELYRGLCAYGLSRQSAAVDHFQTAVKLDPSIALPPLTSPRIRQFFESAVAEHRRRNAPERPASRPPPLIEAPASPSQPPVAGSTSLAEPASNAPFVSSANTTTPPLRRVLPWLTGGIALAATVGFITFGVNAHHLADEANSARFQDDAIAAGDRAHSSARLANVSIGVGLVAAVATALLWADGRQGPAP